VICWVSLIELLTLWEWVAERIELKMKRMISGNNFISSYPSSSSCIIEPFPNETKHERIREKAVHWSLSFSDVAPCWYIVVVLDVAWKGSKSGVDVWSTKEIPFRYRLIHVETIQICHISDICSGLSDAQAGGGRK